NSPSFGFRDWLTSSRPAIQRAPQHIVPCAGFPSPLTITGSCHHLSEPVSKVRCSKNEKHEKDQACRSRRPPAAAHSDRGNAGGVQGCRPCTSNRRCRGEADGTRTDGNGQPGG